MSILNLDFLAGTLTGLFLIPPFVRLLSTGRLDGWSEAPKRKPPVGTRVLAAIPGHWRDRGTRVGVLTYNGPDADGEIPEDAPLLWRPMPKTPWMPGDMDR